MVVAVVELLLFYAKTRRRIAVSDQCDATTYKKESRLTYSCWVPLSCFAHGSTRVVERGSGC
jgi:hypothetical protein